MRLRLILIVSFLALYGQRGFGQQSDVPFRKPASASLRVGVFEEDSPARDEHRRSTEDVLWKVIVPRWPISADGRWYWKTDTSSDELDGHFFFYGVYYDLVAGTEEERNRRE